MKKISYCLSLLLCTLVLFCSCDNEPLTGEFFSTPDGRDPDEFCADAAVTVTTAQGALAAGPPEQQAELCEALIETINSVISTCGDDTGIYQALLDDLGDDCMI